MVRLEMPTCPQPRQRSSIIRLLDKCPSPSQGCHSWVIKTCFDHGSQKCLIFAAERNNLQ